MNLRKLNLLPANFLLILLAKNTVNKRVFLIPYFENLVKSEFVVGILILRIFNGYDQI